MLNSAQLLFSPRLADGDQLLAREIPSSVWFCDPGANIQLPNCGKAGVLIKTVPKIPKSRGVNNPGSVCDVPLLVQLHFKHKRIHNKPPPVPLFSRHI